jgi:hypothetical protein
MLIAGCAAVGLGGVGRRAGSGAGAIGSVVSVGSVVISGAMVVVVARRAASRWEAAAVDACELLALDDVVVVDVGSSSVSSMDDSADEASLPAFADGEALAMPVGTSASSAQMLTTADHRALSCIAASSAALSDAPPSSPIR